MDIKNPKDFMNTEFFKAASEHISSIVEQPYEITNALVVKELMLFIEVLMEDAQIGVSHRIEVTEILKEIENDESLKQALKEVDEAISNNHVYKYTYKYSEFCMACNKITPHREQLKEGGGGYLVCKFCEENWEAT